MGVVESASRLFDLLAEKDDTFTRHLRPGLPEDEIRRILAPVGVELPREAIDFYSRFSLPPGYQYGKDQPSLYGGFWLLALEDAVEQYADQRLLFVQVGMEEEGAEREGWFPVLQLDADFYMLDTRHPVNGACPVIGTTEYLDADLTFVSLQAMFDTFYHWVHEGVLPVVYGGVAGEYEGDSARVAAIAARFNPGVPSWQT